MYACESMDLNAKVFASLFPVGQEVRLNQCATGAGDSRRIITEGTSAIVEKHVQTGGLFAMVVTLKEEPTCRVQVGESDVKRSWER